MKDEFISQLLESMRDMEDDMDFIEVQHNQATAAASVPAACLR